MSCSARGKEERWLQPIPAEELAGVWWQVYPLIYGAAERSGGRYEAADIKKAIESLDMQLWIIRAGDSVEAVAVTEIIQYPRRKLVKVNIGAGKNYKEWIPLLAEIEEWGKENGRNGS